MSIVIDQPNLKLFQGNVLDELDNVEDNSVDVIVTSPPYWNLRDYKTDPQDYGDWIGQLGLEPTIDMYIAHLVGIFEKCKRVLKDTGSLWVNLGDTYNGTKKGNTDEKHVNIVSDQQFVKKTQKDIAVKSLCMIPSKFAIAMLEKGWVLRNKIIWHKPNVMPQSCKTRFNVDYEEIFFFTKTNDYYFNQLMEPSTTPGKSRIMRTTWSINTISTNDKHCAKYPTQLVERPILSCSPPQGVILDIFAGSGSTLSYCVEHGYRSIGIELSPEYIEVIKNRLKCEYQSLDKWTD